MMNWQCDSVLLHRKPVDFRKSINGLTAIVEQEMGSDVFSEQVFVFCNKKRDKLKVIYWDKTGFALWYKRLEKHTFKWPIKEPTEVITLSNEQWQWLLLGMSVVPHQPLYYASDSL